MLIFNRKKYTKGDRYWNKVVGLWHLDVVADGLAMSGIAGDGQAASTRWAMLLMGIQPMQNLVRDP